MSISGKRQRWMQFADATRAGAGSTSCPRFEGRASLLFDRAGHSVRATQRGQRPARRRIEQSALVRASGGAALRPRSLRCRFVGGLHPPYKALRSIGIPSYGSLNARGAVPTAEGTRPPQAAAFQPRPSTSASPEHALSSGLYYPQAIRVCPREKHSSTR